MPAVAFPIFAVMAGLVALGVISPAAMSWLGNWFVKSARLPFAIKNKIGDAIINAGIEMGRYFGHHAGRVDQQVALGFHKTAQAVEDASSAVADAARGIWNIGNYIHRVVRPHAVWSSIAQGRAHEGASAGRAKQLAQTVQADHMAIEHPTAGRLAAGTVTIVKPTTVKVEKLTEVVHSYTLAMPIGVAERLPGEVTDLRARAREAEGVFERLWAKVKGLDKVVYGIGAAALVATMIGRLGGGWIFCRNWKRVGRSVCRMPTALLSSLLGLGLAFLVVVDPVAVADAAEVMVDEIGDVLHKIAE